MRPLSLPATASITSVCCGTMTGVELTPCDRNSAAIVDHPRPADDFRSSESGYFFAPCVCKSIVTWLTAPRLFRHLCHKQCQLNASRRAVITNQKTNQNSVRYRFLSVTFYLEA